MTVYVRGARLSAFIFALMSAVTLAFAGCDGDDGGNGAANGAGPLQTVTARASNAPKLQEGIVRSGSLGYSAELPGSWNILPTGELPQGLQDTFVALQDTGQLAATIQVRCFNAEDEVAGAQAALTETNRAFPDATPGPARTVDGHAAVSVHYTAGTEPTNVEREDIVFASDRCVWTISLVNAPGARADHLGEFETFLSTFRATQ
jgi:hypothetical protein